MRSTARILVALLWSSSALAAGELTADAPDLLCKMHEVAAGSYGEGTLRKLDSISARDTVTRYYNIDLKAGTARRRSGDGRYGDDNLRVGVEPNALVFLFENPGFTKTMATVLMEKRDEGFPIVSTQHGWWRNDLTLGVEVGTCVASSKL